MEHLLSNPLPEKGWTLPVRLEKMAAWNGSAPNPAMHLDVPAVLLPGITPEGFSSQALVRAWKGSGMSPSQAFSALELVKRAIPDMEHVSSGKRTPLIMRSLATNLESQEKFAPYLDSMSQSQGVESDKEVLPEGWTQDSWDAMWENVEAHVRASGDVPSVMPSEGGYGAGTDLPGEDSPNYGASVPLPHIGCVAVPRGHVRDCRAIGKGQCPAGAGHRVGRKSAWAGWKGGVDPWAPPAPGGLWRNGFSQS